MENEAFGHSLIYLLSGDQVYGVRFLGNVDLKKAQKQLHLKEPLEIASQEDVQKETYIRWCVDYRLEKFYPQAIVLNSDVAW